MYYKDLFKLCNFSDEEIEQNKERIEKVFRLAEIGEDDVKRGIDRLHKYFWMESAGVRKEWGIWMKQFIDQALCKEEHEKVIYYTYPLEPRLGTSINLAGYYAATPEFVNLFILGLMFDMAEPYFDLAEASGMAPGAGHCGANKMRLGGFLKGLNPMPDVFLVSSFFCDNESKTDELIDQPLSKILGSKFAEAKILDVLTRQGIIRELDRQYVKKDGSRIVVHIAGSVMRGSNNSVEGLILIAQDISERRRIEEEKNHADRLLKQIHC